MVQGDLDAALQQRQKMLENQILAADRALKSTGSKLARMGTFQVENAVNQLQIAKSMETVTGNVLTTNGLNDVNRWIMISIENFQEPFRRKLQIGLRVDEIEY